MLILIRKHSFSSSSGLFGKANWAIKMCNQNPKQTAGWLAQLAHSETNSGLVLILKKKLTKSNNGGKQNRIPSRNAEYSN